MYLLVFTFLLLGILWLMQTVFLNSFYKHIKTNEIERIVNTIIREHLEDRDDFQLFIEEVARLNAIDIEIVSADNDAIFFAQNRDGNFLRLTDRGREFIINEARSADSFRMVYNFADFYNLSVGSAITFAEITPTHRVITEPFDIVITNNFSYDATPILSAEFTPSTFTTEARSAVIADITDEERAHIMVTRGGLTSLEPAGISIRAHSIGRTNFMDEEWLIYAKAIEGIGGNGDIVIVRSRITPVDATVDTLRVQLFYISIFMVLISIVISFVIARYVSRPIEKINISAKDLAKGNHDVDFTCEGYKEIIELSETLNYTAIELSKVEMLRRELIANMSHDLRTPLTLISGFAEMMRDLPEENTKENASIIVDETIRLTSIVNNLLEFSKLQAGVQKLELEEYNLTESLLSVVNTFNGLIKKDGYKVNFICEKDFIIKSDEDKIKQAFYNLLTNAVNYTGANKEVDVFLEEKESRVIVSVTDYGEGIDKENLPYIWDRYYKVDKVHKRAVTGTGIGLSIVKTILEMCPDTEYGVNSDVGMGTTFYFSFKL